MRPTTEQQAIIDAARAGKTITVQAGAGCGKTSTLQATAEQALTGKRVLCVVYNRSVRLELQRRMPQNVACHTNHSFAMQIIRNQWGSMLDRINGPRQSGKTQATILSLSGPARINDHTVLSPAARARLAMGAILAWCKSEDVDLQPHHITPPRSITAEADVARLREVILPIANAARADIRSPRGSLTWQHDYYLKMAQLKLARSGGSQALPFDVIMMDECQDVNPVAASLYLDMQTHAQRIIVGDSCQPAGTLVTVVTAPAKKGRNGSGTPAQTAQVPIEQIKPGDMVVSMNVEKSFIHRNGSPVSGVSAQPYEGDMIKIETSEGVISRYTPDHHCVVRFGEELVDKHIVYLMKRGDDYRIGITSGRVQSQNKRIGVMWRATQEKADAAWILSVHDTRQDAALAEMVTAWTYGIPTLTFRVSNNSTMSQVYLDYFWSKCGGNRDAAERVLNAHGRWIDFPLWNSSERYLQTRRPTVIRACNLIDGMEVLPLSNTMLTRRTEAPARQWSRISVAREPYQGWIYSMTVERDHTYVGDGIFTHNCQAINGWNGAVDILRTFPADELLFLSKSFRFGPAIAAEANKWLELLKAPLRLEGHPPVGSTIGPVPAPDAVLCRTNAAAMGEVFSILKANGTPAMVGGGSEIVSLAMAAEQLQDGRLTDHPDLCGFANWGEVQDYVEQDPLGQDLKVFVDLVNEYGADEIRRAALQVKDASKARPGDIVISTAHRSKGLEWNNVRVAGDFRQPNPDTTRSGDAPVNREELMLNYVTVTRAQKVLDRGSLAWIDDYVPGAPAAAPASRTISGGSRRAKPLPIAV
ncbi:AAA family ATPase (plasmid) [Streptosporangium sandarakinum]|uniref:AAA family ATPase n=1 Tax=Streptosporangium sandarakinum TaxID=1260955 RepID=UPI003D8FEA3C